MTHPKYIVWVEVTQYDKDGNRVDSKASSCSCDTVADLPSAAKVAAEIMKYKEVGE